jgi:hypothetical protein
MTLGKRFYVTGGTMGFDTPSYVPRSADKELHEHLLAGDFCYVLTSRQMGKSSLMVQTANQLRQAGVTVAVVDLTGIGIGVTPAQWYDGLLSRIARQVDLEDEVEDYWNNNERFSALQKCMGAIRDVVLPNCSGRLVIFIDEIDAVRSLPFSADEFFAAIRECFNRRVDDEQLRRLSFCLLGVATPSDLIRSTEMTPFNIGTRIELHDFTPAEALRLAVGLGKDREIAVTLLNRILWWTGGHPFLTQRFCQAVVEGGTVKSTDDIDELCEREFLSHEARQRDDNLAFVRDRILRSDVDIASLLDLYSNIRSGVVVRDQPDIRVSALRLSGIIRNDGEQLKVRNRIYERVFDAAWVQSSMPDAEVRRQRAAFRRGLIRATAIASVVILALTASVVAAVVQWRRAESNRVDLETTVTDLESTTRALKETADDLTQSRDQERILRQVADGQVEKVKMALADAVLARAAEQAQRKIASDNLKIAEDALKRANVAAQKALAAETAERKLRALADSRLEDADQAKLLAQQQEQIARQARDAEAKLRQLADRRSREAIEARQTAEAASQLFAELLPWLQEHAVEGVKKLADSLVKQGKHDEALSAYVGFVDLVLGEEQGVEIARLLQLSPTDLRLLNIDREVSSSRISVQPSVMYELVLSPATQLGERLLQRDDAVDDLPLAERVKNRNSMARLYAAKGSLEVSGWSNSPATDQRLPLAIRSYTRAIELDQTQSNFHIGRAWAKFRSAERDFAAIRDDLHSAIELFEDPPESPSDETNDRQRQWAVLHYAYGNCHEFIGDASDSTAALAIYRQATDSMLIARRYDEKDPQFAVALGRVARKSALRAAPNERAVYVATARRAIAEAIEIDREDAESYNELGQLELISNQFPKAVSAFRLAVQFGSAGSRSNLYRYYCNLANALVRQNQPASYEAASQAAGDALKLYPNDGSEAAYYLGIAAWRSKQLDTAAKHFAEAIQWDAEYIAPRLARSQLILERQDGKSDAQQLRQADDDLRLVEQLVEKTNVSSSDRAKFHYVYGLKWLKQHVDTKSERALIESLGQLLTASKTAPAYRSATKPIFDYAAKWNWTKDDDRKAADELQQAYRDLQ